MHPNLQRYFEEIEGGRARLLSEVSRLSEAKFIQQGEGGKWSAAQILTHLLTSEQMSLRYMKKKSLGIDQLSNSGIYESIKTVVLKVSQRIPIKYKAPALLVEHTPSALSQADLVLRWNEFRLELKSFLEAIEAKNIRKKIYKHPVAGRLNVMQAMQFFQEHIHHHYPQIKKNIR
jgi:hypothetical protein